MPTVEDVIKDVIFEEKNETLKLMYNIDVFIQEFEDKGEETPAEEPVAPTETPAEEAPAAEETPAEESVDENGEILNEAIFKREVEGELVVPKEEAMNIQTLQDLVDYMSDKQHKGDEKVSPVAKILGKKPKLESKGKIISPLIQEVILIMAGAGQGELDKIVSEGDKIIIEVKYGKDKSNNIGFKINKNSGTSVFSIMLIKDGELLSGAFNQTILNKQILFFRNSIA